MNAPPPSNAVVLCAGEVVWDVLPAGRHLGGAPYNVAYHLVRQGLKAALVSRVGDDALGREARKRIGGAGVDPALVQTHARLQTGTVRVALDASGTPSYEVARPAAWDALALTDEALEAARAASAVVFGSLAQRSEPTAGTIRALAEAAPRAVFDANLRPPFVDRAAVAASLEAADWVKLNDEELATLADWFGWAEGLQGQATALAKRFGCGLVCVTRGDRGGALWHAGRWTEHEGYRVNVADTVGAGDAFLAGLLPALLGGTEDDAALDRACRLGAFVASRRGATPAYDPAEVRRGS